jgi:hypothetical protein
MNLEPTHKLAAIVLAISSIVLIEGLRSQIISWQERPSSLSNCIWDPLHQLLLPISIQLESQHLARKLLLALDSLVIDGVIIFLGLTWAFTGRTKGFIPSLLAFYIVRAIILNVGQWPLPKVYLFGDPGLPSMFVDYDRTNDLYFSGHCGGITVMLTDSFLHRRNALVIILSLLLAYTFFILAVEGGHYTNDMIIGTIVGFTICRIYYDVKEPAALFFLKSWSRFCRVIVSRFIQFESAMDSKNSLQIIKAPNSAKVNSEVAKQTNGECEFFSAV